ncbi:MAG TPA: cyanophycinase [Candidatus Limnocylindrales bacterium]
MRRILLALAIVAASLSGGAATASEPTKGTLFLIGGALADDNNAIYGEFVRQAGGAQARIGVLSASSAQPHWSANDAMKQLKRHGAGDAVWIPVSLKKDGSGEDPANVALAAGATAFFFTGGDQFRYVQTMIRPDGTDGAVLSAIRQRFAAGAPIAGTSAGMQIFAGPDMITGGLSYYGVRDGSQPGYFDTEEVLGYWPAGGFDFFAAGLVDTHFDARGRNGRSIRLAADTGHQRVFGVGEDTALVVNGPLMRVIGTNGVSILDLRAAAVAGDWSISGVRWSYLVDGDTYNADLWSIFKADIPGVPDERAAKPPTQDIFGSYEMLDAALDLTAAGLSTGTTGTTAETDPQFTVTLTKGAGFAPYARSFTDLSVAIG